MKNHFKNSSANISRAQAENTFNFNSTIFLDGKLHYGFGDVGIFIEYRVCERVHMEEKLPRGRRDDDDVKVKMETFIHFFSFPALKVDIYGRVEEGDNLTCTWLCVQQQLRSCPQHHNLSC